MSNITLDVGDIVKYADADDPAVFLDPTLTLADTASDTITGATVTIESPEGISGETLSFTNQNGITGSYNATTDVLTLSGTASIADYQAALQSITFSSTVDPTDGGAYQFAPINWSVTDSLGNIGTGQSIVDYSPAIVAGALVTYVPGGGPIVLDSSLAIVDSDSSTITGATVSIFHNFVSGDQLGFTNQNGITGTYHPLTGELTLTGSASIADYQAALDSVTYNFTGANVTNGGADTTRDIQWTVTDSAANTLSNDSAVEIARPTIDPGDVAATFFGGGPAVALDPTLTVSEFGESVNMAGATVRFTGFGFISDSDILHFTNQNGITGSYDSTTGILSLTGTASIANYQAALDSVTYSFTPTNSDPTNGGSDTSRQITWQITDTNNIVSAPQTSTLNVDHTPPSLNNLSVSPVSFYADAPPVPLDSTLTVSDPDSSVIFGATVSIASGLFSGDALDFTNQNGITGSYSGGVLTLTGTASLADYQEALKSIAYASTNGNPTNSGADLSRTIDWQISDSVSTSAIVTSTVNVEGPFSFDVAGPTPTFDGGGAPVFVSQVVIVNEPGVLIDQASVSIGAGFIAGLDTLNFTNQNNITGHYNAATGVLTLTGAASASDYSAALQSIAYSFSPANGDPTNGGGDTSRLISWSVTDAVGNSLGNISTLDVVHVSPTVTAGAAVTFIAGGQPVALDPGLTVSDPDSGGNLVSATVTIGSGHGDPLNFTNQSGITGSFEPTTGVLTLSGLASVADYQTALESITFSTTAPGGSLEIGWSVNDGVANSTQAFSTVTVDALPTLTAGATATFTGGGSPATLDSALAIAAGTHADLAGATVTIGAGFTAGDTLNCISQNGISGNFNASTHVLTLTGPASVADYQAALDSVTYSFDPSNGDPTNGGGDISRTISWQVNDGVAESMAVTSTLDTVHAPPTVTAGATATFAGGGSPVTLDSALTVADVDSGGHLAIATVSIGKGFIGGDALSFDNQNGISGSYNATTGVLTLTGAASVADYQAALESVTYSFTPTDGDPTAGGGDTSRTISWQVNDGVDNSTVVTSTLDTVHVAPTVTAGATVTFTGGGLPVTLDAALTVADVDSGGHLASATVSIGSGFTAGDTLNFTNQNGITGSYNAVTGDLTLSGTASVADYQAALDSVTYGFTPSNGDPTNGGGDTSRTINWQVNDGVDNSTVVTSTLDTAHVAPTVTAGATQTFFGGGSPVTLDAALTVSDPDSGGHLAGATVSIGAGFTAGDTLNFTNQNGITGVYNASTGELALSGTASVADYQAALESVAYSFTPTDGDPTAGGADTARTISWQVNDGAANSTSVTSILDAVHVPPTVTAGATATFTGGGVPVLLDAGLTVTDPDSGGDLIGAKVSIGKGFIGGDALSFDNQNGISGSYNATTGVLTLTGAASVADYQTALESITYAFNPPFGDPTGGGSDVARTINWQVMDDATVSSPATSTLAVIHSGPVLVAGATSTFYGGPAVALDPSISVSDADSGGNLASATVSIGSGFLAGDELNFTSQSGITGSYDAATGVLSLHGTASVAGYQAALASVTYGFDFSNGDPTAGGADTSRAIVWQVNDGAASTSATSTLDVVPVIEDLTNAFTNVLRGGPDSAFALSPTITLPDPTTVPNPMFEDAQTLQSLISQVESGQISLAEALNTVEHFADSTTSVATLAYQFFTGSTPTSAGYDYLVNSPANPDDLNDPYYAQFNAQNRYINFAVNLGKNGAGAASFNAAYGALDLNQAMAKAYAAIFGFTPAAGKIDAILSAVVGADGETRADYFATYGGDGADGVGTKAAAVGWLMTLAVQDDLGVYAAANDDLLAALANGTAQYNVDLLTAYPTMTAAQAQAMAAEGVSSIVNPLSVTDSGANVAAHLDALQALAAGHELAPITLTDTTTPILVIAGAQYSADAQALGDIASPYSLDITSATAAAAGGLQADSHVVAFTVSDSAANISAALDALEVDPKLTGVSLSDANPISISVSQLTADGHVLGLIGSPYALFVTGTLLQFNNVTVPEITAPGSALDITNAAPGAITGEFAENSAGTSGLLIINEGTHEIAVTLVGQAAAPGFAGSASDAGFVFGPDGAGGTEITWH